MIDARDYWDQRLRSHYNLDGVGCIGLGNFFNAYVYRAKVRTLQRVCRKFKISPRAREVLDVGSGTGFWVDYYLSEYVKLIYGVDISRVAIKYLARKYRGHNNVKLFEGDFSYLDLDKKFDIVNAFDVAYHVVDDKFFVKFVKNLCRHLGDGGFLFITDTFNHDYREETTYLKFRSLVTYRKILEQAGVEIVSIVPVYSILSWPFTGKRKLDGILTSFYLLSTQLYRVFRPSIKFAYYVDSFLTQFSTLGISMKLLLGRKPGE